MYIYDLYIILQSVFAVNTLNVIFYMYSDIIYTMYIPQESPDDFLPGPKYVVSRLIKTFVCV
jgi:hypothetical protein